MYCEIHIKNMWKLTSIHLIQILLHRRTCCWTVGSAIGNLHLSAPSKSPQLQTATNAESMPTGNKWVKKGLNSPTQYSKPKAGRSLMGNICSRAPHKVASQSSFSLRFKSGFSHFSWKTSSQCMHQEYSLWCHLKN